MAYSQNTITDVNPGAAMQSQLDLLFLSDGWTVEDSFNLAGDNRAKVYKSAAANNDCGYDWFVAVVWSATGSAGVFNILAGSTYNSGTKVLGFVTATTGTISPATAGAWVDGKIFPDVTLNDALVTTTGTVQSLTQANSGRHILSASSFGYWASITGDHVSVAFTGSATGSTTYATLDVDALYPTFYNGADANPVTIWKDSAYGINKSYKHATAGGAAGVFQFKTRFSEGGAAFNSSTLPVLSGPNDLTAKAYRPRVSLIPSNFTLAGLTYAVTPNNQSLGTSYIDGLSYVSFNSEPIIVGDAIDLWQIRGGSIGDTFQVGVDIYVILAANGLAVKVEED